MDVSAVLVGFVGARRLRREKEAERMIPSILDQPQFKRLLGNDGERKEERRGGRRMEKKGMKEKVSATK